MVDKLELRNVSNKEGTSMKKIHLICGTHWDREWRHTAEQSKLRLCDLMDYILEVLETNPEYDSFTVDGGLIVLEDYLNVRPENEERIKKLIAAKRLHIVNWYTLPETNTVAAEALIRNIAIGQKMGAYFGGGMKSGYTATSYGQPSQLPQLYSGFDIPDAIFYRGTNKYLETPLFDWTAPDGSKIRVLRTFDEVTRTNWFFYVHGPAVLGKAQKDLSYTYKSEDIPVHMADLGSYEKAFVLLHEDFDYIHDEKTLKSALDGLLGQALPYAIGDNVLALNMEDNDEPYYKLPELVKDLNKIYPDEYEIVQTDIDTYMDTIMGLADSGKYKCGHYEGELRYTTCEYDNFNGLLGATHSSRINIKLINENCETNLIDLAEPLASYASIYGKEYPLSNLDRAWKALLKNHAHDSICGAAVDQAHKDMLYNFSLAKTVAEEATNRSCVALYGHIDTSAYEVGTSFPIVVFNTLPFARKEVIELIIDTPKGNYKAADIGVAGAASLGDFYDIFDSEGNLVPSKEIARDDISIGVERQMDTKAIKFAASRKRVLLEVEVPENGYTTYVLKMRGPNIVHFPEIMPDRPLIARENGVLENEHLKVTINPNGTYDILEKDNGRLMKGLGFYSDDGEVGSAHMTSKPKANVTYLSLGCPARIEMLESNELRGRFRISIEMEIPTDAYLNGHDRSRQMKKLPIETILTLEKGSPCLKVKTKLINSSRDHKLYVNFPTGLTKADWVDVESQWDVAKRTVHFRDHKDNFESFPSYQPMQNYVDVYDGDNGFAFLSKGLREYEASDDSERTLKITLIRTQRAYMTANSAMTVEELDKYTGQHCLGEMEYEFALYPHKGNYREASVAQVAYMHKVPMKAISGTPKKGELPIKNSFISVKELNHEGGIMPGALKLSENGKGYIYRIWNLDHEKKEIELKINLPFSSLSKIRMNEKDPVLLKAEKDGTYRITLRPAEIASFYIER